MNCPLLLVVPKHDNICDVHEAAEVARDVPKSELVELGGGKYL